MSESIEDITDRIQELEALTHNLEKDLVLTAQSLDLSQRLLTTVENHIHALESVVSDLVIEQRLMQQKVEIFIGYFKWMFPSLLVLVSILASLALLIGSGRMVIT